MSTELDALLSMRDVRPEFQPIVDLTTGRTVAYEALARGPRAGGLYGADALFAAARAEDRLAELDRLCCERALETALEAGPDAPWWLFVNIEPSVLGRTDGIVGRLVELRRRGVGVMVEFCERDLTDDPAALVAFADAARSAGVGVALDDVGVHPASLALMPFLRPDVVKLDLSLVHRRPDTASARVMTAVTAYAESEGARILAEGIETAEQERTARSLGATLGQGWRYGRPTPPRGSGPRPGAPAGTGSALTLLPDPGPRGPRTDSPYVAAARVRTPRTASRGLLASVSTLLETQAGELGEAAVVLAGFEEGAHLTPPVARRYADLAATAAFVVVLGTGMATDPARGVRGVDLRPGDPLAIEWDVVVVGPHFAGALVARERTDVRPGEERMFDYVLTYDRPLVLDVARSLMDRVLPHAGGPVGPARRHSPARRAAFPHGDPAPDDREV